MKRYFVPIALAFIINIAFICAIIFLQPKTIIPHRHPMIKITHIKQMQSTVTHHKHKLTAKQWLQRHYANNATIVKQFTAGANLQGFVITLKSNPQNKAIMYSVNHGQYYLLGTVINHQGHNLSVKNTHQYITDSKNKVIYEQAIKLPGILQGRISTPRVTIIIDPNSNIFPMLWQQMLLDTSQGVFSVNWVLINYLKPMGPNIAANILQAKHPIKALAINAQHYNSNTQTGGYLINNSSMNPNTKKILRRNWDFIQKFNLYQLPVTILAHKKNYYVLQGSVVDETIEQLITGE